MTFRSFRDGERGQALVETALVLPMFLILILGIVDFGRAYQQHITVSGAAREGARLGVTGVPANEITARAALAAGDMAIAVQVDNACGAAGTSLTVRVEHVYTPITPLGQFVTGLGGPIPLRGSADMRLERTGC